MRLISLILIFIIYTGCEESHEYSMAECFMMQVRTETYNEIYLPDIKSSEIPTLLKYRNNHKILNKFPANPISSFICDSVTVGAVALSTIETIRISELYDARNEFTLFPANPCIVDTTNHIKYRFALVDTMAALYYNWWMNSNLPDSEKISINPLNGTSFRWK
jgi:hypothetical protein